jgi:Flp pilus assembly protein TadD
MTAEDANALRSRAAKLTEVGRAAEAIPLLRQALTLSHQDATIHCELARAHLELKQFNEALRHSEAAIGAAPQAEWGHRLRAIILRQLGRDRDALASAQEAVRLAPEEPMAIETLVYAQLACNQTGLARESALFWLELAPDDADCRDALGRIALADRQPKAAEDHFRDAISLNPASARIMSNLGVALENQQRKNEALGCYDRAAKMDPAFDLARKNTRFAIQRGTTFVSLLEFLSGVGWNMFGLVPLLERWNSTSRLSPEMREYLRHQDRRETRNTLQVVCFLGTLTVSGIWTMLLIDDAGARPVTIAGWLMYVGFLIAFIFSLRWILQK